MHHHHNTLTERVWSKIDQRGPDDCWPWTASRFKSGYSQIPVNGKRQYVHRIVYELTHGPLKKGNVVRHTCDHLWCCNPAHLVEDKRGRPTVYSTLPDGARAKKCSQCQQIKSVDDFTGASKTKTGDKVYSAKCKECDPDARKATNAKYRSSHRTTVTCAVCKKQWIKRTDSLEWWQGLCRSCANSKKKLGKPGKPRTKEQIDKIRAANIGRKHSIEARLNMSRAHKGQRTGPANNNWRGGKLSTRTSSPEHKMWRAQVFERDNYTCQACGIRGGKLNAHHIEPYSIAPEKAYDVANGQTLCVACHKLTPTYGPKMLIRLHANAKVRH